MPFLHFKGKPFLKSYHHTVKFHRLVEQPEKSTSKTPSLEDNLIIHGDNLKALKALLPTHAGKIKCIYIDPPYNTGNEGWVYNDNVNSPMIQNWLGQVVPRDDLSRHDKWCCMMYPRLTLLRELLRDDGVILVSIDDNEVHHLRMMMDEVFGEDNFIAQLVWEKGRKNDAKYFSVGHEYMLVYAYSKAILDARKTIWREPKPGAKAIWEKYSELRKQYGPSDDEGVQRSLREWYKSLPETHPSKSLSRYKHVDKWGPWRDRDISWPGGGGPRYDVIHPVTGKPCKVPERGWGFASPASMQRQITLGLVVFREDESAPPFRKAHLLPPSEELDESADILIEDDEEESVAIGMQVMPSVFYKQSQVTVKALRNIMGGKVFETPKDVEVLGRIFRYVADQDAIFLDSFAGSGTTAHAVLDLNKEDGGNRKFILVECEDYADTITAERVRRVSMGVPEARDEKLREGLGGTFSYYELGDPIDTDAMLDGTDLPSFADLAKYAFHTATGEKLDIDQLDPHSYYVGSSKTFEVFLIYEPDKERLKQLALNLPLAEQIHARFPNKRKLVYAPCCYLEDWRLGDFNISFAQLPFEIYRLAA